MKKLFLLLTILSNSILSQTHSKNEKIFHQFSPQIALNQFETWMNKNYSSNYKLEFSIRSEENDELGFKHIRMEQLYNGIPIKNGMIVVHCKDNRVISFNGLIYTNAIVKSSTNTKESDAYLTAIESIPSSQYAWETTTSKNTRKRTPLQANRPKGTFVYVFKNNEDGEVLELTYNFPIYSLSPLTYKEVYVSCGTGTIINTEEKIHSLSTIGKGKCKYSGWQNIVTDSSATGFTLKDTTRGNGIETYNSKTTKLFENKKNIWDTTTIDQYAIDAHWGAEMTYDYYLKNHNRNSIDNKGYKLINRLRYGTKFINAFWDGTQMNYGDGNDTINPLVSLDIIGHEITHGLTANTAKLILENESGALNESFSDIFGATIDWYTRPDKANWHVGEEVSRTYRSLENPGYNKDPKNYKGINWKPLNGSDLGGIHSNNGVQNHWYYLLTKGGSGTNDFGNSYNVTGIGIDKAAKIAYRNLTIYLTSKSDFEDARFFSIQAAKDLFGACSPEVESTTNAWYAVGVGEPYVAGLKSNFSLSSNTSFDSLFVFFQNKSINSDSCFWDFGDGTTSRLFHPTHNYKNLGTYSVKLISYGNQNCGEVDTLIFKDIIRIKERILDTINYSFCDSSNLTLFHSVQKPKSQWYSSLSDSSWISTNSQLDVKVTNDTAYYSKEIPTYFGEKDALTNSANYAFAARHLIFTAHSSFLLKSAIVNSYAKGERTIELRTSKGEVIQQRKILIDTIGTVRIPINFKIDPGVDYQLGVSGSFVNLGRTRNTVNYPYQLDSVVTITRSNAIDMATNAGTLFYYFFYDWEILNYNESYHKLHQIKKSNKPLASFKTSASNCIDSLFVFFNNNSQNSDSSFWDFGDGNNSNLFHTTHKYTKIGTYSVKLIAYGKCNLSDSVILIDRIKINPSIINTLNYTICDSNNLSLVHSPQQPKVQWYSSLSDSSLITTNTKLNIILDKDTIYYSRVLPNYIGEKDPLTNSEIYKSSDRHLIFSTYSSFLLKSAIVNSYAKGERTIELRTSKGEVIQQRKILIDTIGIVRIPINFKIDPGVDYQLGVSGSFVNLGRTRNTVNYPYQLDSIVTITRSNAIDLATNAGTLFYYFFYDWEIIPTEKTQTKAHVIKKIMKPIPSFELTQLDEKLIQLESTSKFADSIFWKIAKKDSMYDTLWITQPWSSNKKLFVIQTEFNPIRVQLNVSNKCYSDSLFKSIQLKTTNTKNHTLNNFLIYPNPANEFVNIEGFSEIGDVTIKDITGKVIHRYATKNKYMQINTNQLPDGYYFIEISNSNGITSEKLIKTH